MYKSDASGVSVSAWHPPPPAHRLYFTRNPCISISPEIFLIYHKGGQKIVIYSFILYYIVPNLTKITNFKRLCHVVYLDLKHSKVPLTFRLLRHIHRHLRFRSEPWNWIILFFFSRCSGLPLLQGSHHLGVTFMYRFYYNKKKKTWKIKILKLAKGIFSNTY